MEIGKLTVEYRIQSGKNETRRLRASGRVPGICYGFKAEPLPISLTAKELKKALDPEKRQNTVINMTVNGAPDAASKSLTVMLRDYQVDSLRGDVQHVDLVIIDVNREVTVTVPISLVGKAAGVVAGGQLHAVFRAIPVLCKPADIPVRLDADVTALGIGDALHVKDLKLPKGVRAGLSGDETIASVVAPQVEKVVAETSAEAVEGAPAGTAAAPAAGAAAAGAAPAKAEEKKAGGKDKK
jgi:large subunit ribosomal protein L25